MCLEERLVNLRLKKGEKLKCRLPSPISKIVDFIKDVKNKLSKIYPDSEIINFGHIGDGNLHFNFSPFFNRKFTNSSLRHEAHNSFIMENENFVRTCIKIIFGVFFL